MTDDKLPPWLSDNSDDSDDNELPDWLQNTDDDSPQSPNRLGVTGELSWMQDESSDDDKPKKGRASTGLTGELSWNQGDDTPDFLQDISPSNTSSSQTDDDVPDWLKGDADEDDNSGLPDWLDDAALEDSERLAQQSLAMSDDILIQDDDESDSEELPAWLTSDDDSSTEDDFATAESNVFSGGVDTSTWGDFEGSSDEFIADDEEPEFESAFTDDSWISDTETPSLEEDFSDLFAQSSPISNFSASDLPTTGMLFGEDDFADDGNEEMFDLLGGDDFDLLGELNEDMESDEFDFLSEMIAPETPIADALASDENFMAKFADEDDIFADDDVNIGMLLGEEDVEDDPFRQFEPNKPSNEPVGDDLSWLDDISNVPFQDTRPEPLFKPENRPKPSQKQPEPEPELDIENYLASLDDVPLSSLSDDFGSAELDFETLFEDEATAGISGLSPDAPSWLTDLTAVTSGENSAAAILSQQKDRPAEELPDRLKALRERGFEVQSKPKDDAKVLSAIMTSEAGMAESSDSAIATVTLTAGQVQRAELLRTIVGNALEADAEKDKPRRQRRLPIERIFITLVLLAVVIAPFFVSSLRIGDPPPNQFVFGSRQDAFFRLINAVPAGQYVLVATEYGAMSAGELDIATESVLRHVLVNGGIPVIISSDAVGLVRVDNLMQSIAEQNRLIANRDYVVVRYLVTDVVGLRDFSENIGRYLSFDVDGNPTGLRINSINDFARVVIITESADNLRLWGEQVLPLMIQPFLAVTSYSAAPLSEPYLNSRAGAYLSGYSDSYTYQTMVNSVLLGGDPFAIPTLPPTVEVIITEPTPTELVVVPVITEITAEATGEMTPDADATAIIEITQIVTEGATLATETVVEATGEATATQDVSVTTEVPSATPTPSPTPTATPIVERFAVITASTPINIRPDPSTTNPPVGVLRPEERALILNQVTGVDGQQWYNITFVNGAGETVVGWVREDLIRIEESIVTPTVMPTLTPTTTPSSKRLAMLGWQLPQKGQESTPEVTPEATPESTPDAESTAEITPEVTAVAIPTELPVVITVDVPLFATERLIAPMDVTDRQARWDSMALGILGAVVVIAVGNLFNLVRVIFRKRRR
ncbi:MAG: SH3 domain-containing protein [bacterium]|nr:SH3 domain-containing protein [bacterium]